MTVVGLHPEELFDKLLDGEITPLERERLRQHLDGCEVCRFEYAARLDFQAEALELATTTPPLALPLHPPLPAAEERVSPVPTSRPRRRARLVVWGLAAALLITASGAVASGFAGRAPWHAWGSLFSQTNVPSAPAAAPKKAPQVVVPATAVPALVAAAVPAAPAPDVAVPPVAETAPQALPQHHAPPLARAQALRSTDAPTTVVAALPAHTDMPPVKDAASKEPSSAAKLFGEANQARRSGDVGRASGLYHLLQEQFPGSPEADLSRVTLALLLLDSGDAQGALGGFERYLAGGSRGLEAEALVGRARALGRLGRHDQEADAWREVQRKYPRSIYGRQANERLAALGQP